MSVELSIIIPCYNKFNFTKSALDDLFRLPDNHEIIIIDNASTDETQTELQKITRKNFLYLRNENNYGFGCANNRAYLHSTGANVLFLNNDIRVQTNHHNWTQPLLAAILANQNSLVGPTAGFVDPNNDFSFVYETNDPSKTINYMSGWCLAASRTTWDKLTENNKGPFNEDFFVYFEDTDLSFRAAKLGITFQIVNVPVVHFGKTSSKQLNIADLYLASKSIFIKKWKNK
jgi:O-antigen biosynthesis protein